MGTGLLKILVLMVASMNCLAPSSASSFFKDKPWERRKPILSVSATSSSFASSSIVLPLQGNVYPNGFYNVTLYVGQPPKPYFLDPDTGSDLTWLQCDAPCQQCTETPHPLYRPSDDLVPCKDPLCMSLHSSVDHRCENPDQCDYEVEYADGGSSLGVLVRDIFPLNLTNGDPIRPRLALGCGYDQIPGSSYYHPMDGILGLGKGAVSIVSQLHNQGIIRNVIGHCFSSRGGGYLFFGDDIYDSHRVVWTPMSRDYPKHYSPGLGELIFNGRSTGLRNLFAVFDSGSSYTYFNAQAYQVLTSLLNRELAGKPLREAMDDDTLPLCWRGRKPFKSLRDVRKYFKPLALSFSSGGRSKAVFEIPMEGYLILSSMGNVCLGILNGTEVGLQNSNIIGDISMHDKIVIYNNEKQAIGWATANCDRVPKSRAAATM
ncbi:aspartic proteinase Asp1 isoform X2 [Momordica charantia]|uniref:Aspartic proteinase Asp1 n=1 Tax=Momordica charantia TaxID=3673 RepID=A0A6J1DZ15_MOMCH|nr:aspartic proteinase Asp1 isoform X2 [Momordica charantia]